VSGRLEVVPACGAPSAALASAITVLPIRVALTLDDAPSIDRPGSPPDPNHMDAIRETLKAHGVTRCVAFVVAETAAGHEGTLERWLADGYELGNHTFDHPRASRVGVPAFVDSIRRCHLMLDSLGAFSGGRTPWFRFPYLSRGQDLAGRTAIQAECEGLGYRVAHASVDFHDDRFENHFAEATRRGDASVAREIGGRYEQVAVESMQFTATRLRESQGRVAPLVPYCHFGLLSVQHLGGILERLNAVGTTLCSLEEAMADPLYATFDADRRRDGLVGHSLPKSPTIRLTRRLALLSERVGVADQRRLGPRWPYLR
jgi:peptidoglycan/xylan/chitin deacetylase (PgdA/CDA1 family)